MLIHWAKAVSGNFATAADWTGGADPGATDTAILDATGNKTYTVTASANETVDAIQLAANAALTVTGQNVVFTAKDGTGGGADAGTIGVLMFSTIQAGGVFDTSGGGLGLVIGSASTVKIEAGGLTLTGTGGMHLAGGVVEGDTVAATLTNESVIVSFGHNPVQLGDGSMTLDNAASGVIESRFSAITINTGANTIVNAGVMVAGVGLSILSPVNNTGRLSSLEGNLVVDGAVTGSGVGVVGDGILDFASTFDENVEFRTGAKGVFELAHSVGYTGNVSGLSKTGVNFLELDDVNYIKGTTTASYSGTTASGMLTVTDGTHTAHINLVGDYVGLTFQLNDNLRGTGVNAAAPPTGAESMVMPLSHGLVAAMASFAPRAAGQLIAGPATIVPARMTLAHPAFIHLARGS